MRAKTERRFARALLMSPAAAPPVEPALELPLWMAPLVVQEVAPKSDGPVQTTGFGAVPGGASKRIRVASAPPTVYHLSGRVAIGGQEYRQLMFLWFYSSAGTRQETRYGGVRLVLGHDGFALAWEVLSSDQAGRVFYVAEPVEAAAAAHYGPPLPGRVFRMEPSVTERPEVVVARALGRGPEPMAPFVYVEAGSLEIGTVLCRCMATQVDAVVGQQTYRLVQLRSWAELGGDLDVLLPALRDSLDGVLRWPPGL